MNKRTLPHFTNEALERARKQRDALDAAERATEEYRVAMTEAVNKGVDGAPRSPCAAGSLTRAPTAR